MFSPYYAWSGWRDPGNHCAMNVALYGDRRNRWAMTERGRLDLRRDAETIEVGRSSMRWDNDALTIDIDEWTAPLPSRLRGKVKLWPRAIAGQSFALDADGRHTWRTIAPRARVEVAFENGAAAWTGEAYFDSNWGDEPLEYRFRDWDWSRAHVGKDGTVVYYDVSPREGAQRSLALKFDGAGAATAISAPPRTTLPRTFWGMKPGTRGQAGNSPRLVRALEDSPFYARSHLTGEVEGEVTDIMYESLSLDRLRNPVVRAMLPFRMPRLTLRR